MPASKPNPSRRSLFLGAAAAAASTVAVTTVPSLRTALHDDLATRPAPERGGGYSLSEHVLRYYRSTRL